MLESRKSLESVDNHMAEAKVEEGFVSSRDERPIGKNTSEQIVGEDGIKPTQELPRRSFIRNNAALLVAGGMIFLIMIAAISISVLLIKAPLHPSKSSSRFTVAPIPTPSCFHSSFAHTISFVKASAFLVSSRANGARVARYRRSCYGASGCFRRVGELHYRADGAARD
jgi:hypothetical protein